MMPDEVQVVAGSVLAYRLFDLAYAIDLARAEEIPACTVRTGATRGRLLMTPPKAVAFGVPPVAPGLDPITINLPEPHSRPSSRSACTISE
jgi:hypothetical protein